LFDPCPLIPRLDTLTPSFKGGGGKYVKIFFVSRLGEGSKMNVELN